MREIKFRVWDRELQEFSNRYFLHANGSLWFNDEGRLGSLEQGAFDIQECTGLKDKNGVEIYEGDIVRIPKYTHKFVIAEIAFGPSGTRFLYRVGYMGSNPWYGENRRAECEVIGNVYESPELARELV